MTNLKVCFIGVGSIATRHIKNLRIVCEKNDIDVIIDAVRRRESVALADDVVIDNVYLSVDELPSDYDVAFITNPTDMHMDTLGDIHNKAKHFFIEKPITSYRNLEAAEGFAYRDDSIYYVACPMRYKKILNYLKQNIDVNDVNGVRCICSSYLPEWRPGTDYRKCYSAHKNMGGGVSIDLIHEWDYLEWIFGMPSKVNAIISKKSDLEIDSDDYAAYIAEYDNMIVELHLDYFGRESIREIMIFTSEDTIIVDILKNKITYRKSGKEIQFEEVRDDSCRLELEHFLDMVSGKISNDNTPKTACKVMKLTQGIL